MTIQEVYEKVMQEKNETQMASREELSKGHKNKASELAQRRSHFAQMAQWLESTGLVK